MSLKFVMKKLGELKNGIKYFKLLSSKKKHWLQGMHAL
jgi:hypothetical protein